MKNNMHTDKLFFAMTRDFLDVYLTKQVGKSPHTTKAYRDALTIFRRYLYGQLHFSIAKFRFIDCTREIVLDFLIYLEQSGNAPGTCNQRLTAIKSYLWYVSDNDISLQPTALSISRIPPRRCQQKVRPVLTENELSSIISQPANSRIGLRDRMILVLLYDTAIRLSEVLDLKLGDINLTAVNPYIRIHGKGDKERIVSVTDKTVEHIKLYLSVFHKESTDGSNYLFYTIIKGNVNRMSSGNVERLIQKYADLAREICPSIPLKVYPHMLRRTRATHLYRNGVELELVSRILGHSSSETTKIYATPSLEMIRKAMDSVETPDAEESPLWLGNEAEMARLCGLR